MPEMEQCKKMMNQEGFLFQRIAKLQEQLRKQERENRELETSLLMYEGLAGRSLHDVGIEDATSLAWMVEMKTQLVYDRMEHIRKEHLASREVEPKMHVPQTVAMEKTPMQVAMEELQRQSWFMEVGSTSDQKVKFGSGDEALPPYSAHCSPWLDPYFPLN
ncbi:SRF-type transcription factor (DNA-binding and dimerization domain) [Musa troglodytarum]|nr:SRF-type transcription factor (DNA-binding and dimerization domain) [Musa troglodytarum]